MKNTDNEVGSVVPGLLSIIIPVFNTERYLRRCIDSIRNQNFQSWEILLIDDGSRDASPQICDAYAEQDARIRVFHQKNSGVSTARNVGLQFAKGEYITFADSDDYILPGMYDDLLALLKDADIASCAYLYEGQQAPQSISVLTYGRLEATSRIVCCDVLSYSLWDKIFRSSVVGDLRFDTAISHNEDLLFVYQALKTVKSVKHTTKPYYVYCNNENSAARSRFSHKFMTAIDVQDRVLADIRKNYPSLYRVALENYLKVNIYTARQMVSARYENDADFSRIRKNAAKHFFFLLCCRLAKGYKKEGIMLIFNLMKK